MRLGDILVGKTVLARRQEAQTLRQEIAALDMIISEKLYRLDQEKAPGLALERECEALLHKSRYARRR